jgi:RNA polymerase sigma-70 factor (ECF subfamily)
MNISPPDDLFVERFVRGQRRVHAYITTLVPDRCDADEVFQETCLLVWQKRHEFDVSREFIPWMCGIAHNLVRNLRRRADRSNVNLSDEVLDLLGQEQLERGIAADERLAALRHCLGSLPPRQVELIERCYGSSKPARYVADQMGILPATMYKQLHRLRRILLNCIQRQLATEEPS